MSDSTSESPLYPKNKKIVKCDACDIESVFENEKEAYLAGWAFKNIAPGLNISYCPACATDSL